MFDIKFRITENLELMKNASAEELDSELYNVCGVFQIKIGSHDVGFYMDEELPVDVYGSEIINLWFSLLINVLLQHEIECEESIMINFAYSSWLKFDFRNSLVDVSEVTLEENEEISSLVMSAEKRKIKVEWLEKEVCYLDFRSKIIESANRFISELNNINPLIIMSEEIRLLTNKLSRLVNVETSLY